MFAGTGGGAQVRSRLVSHVKSQICGLQRRAKSRVHVIIIESEPNHEPPRPQNTFRKVAAALGLGLGGTGLALTSYSHRPSRPAMAMLASGMALGIMAFPEIVTANIMAGSLLGFTAVTLGPFWLKDSRECQIQNLFERARRVIPFPPDVTFDEFGSGGHSVTRPNYEIITSFSQALFTGERERIRLEVMGFITLPTGTIKPVVGHVYASRRLPWCEYEIDRVELPEA